MTRTHSRASTCSSAGFSGKHLAAGFVLSLSACITESAPIEREDSRPSRVLARNDASAHAVPPRDAAPEEPLPATDGALLDVWVDDASAYSRADRDAAADDALGEAARADAARLVPEGERPCRPWKVATVGSALGALENLLPDGTDGLLLADTTGGRLLRFSYADHAVTVLRSDMPAIGGLALRDGWIYAALGNDILSGLTGTQDGQIVRFLEAEGALEVWADRLIMPNGLALLPDDSAVTTRDIDLFGATPSGITRVPSAPPRERQLSWSSLEGCNGAAVDPAGIWLYVSRTFSERAEIWRVAVDDPRQAELVADLGPGLALLLDDLTVTQRYVYVAANLAGSVFRVDVESGASCEIASGLAFPSALKFGGRDHASGRGRLYATSLAGDLYELRDE